MTRVVVLSEGQSIRQEALANTYSAAVKAVKKSYQAMLAEHVENACFELRKSPLHSVGG